MCSESAMCARRCGGVEARRRRGRGGEENDRRGTVEADEVRERSNTMARMHEEKRGASAMSSVVAPSESPRTRCGVCRSLLSHARLEAHCSGRSVRTRAARCTRVHTRTCACACACA
jgi:hypothetical protein